MTIQWYQRLDGLWNGQCGCGSTLAGIEYREQVQATSWHNPKCEGVKGNPVEVEGDEVIIEFVNRLKCFEAIVTKYVKEGSRDFLVELRREWRSDFGESVVRIESFVPPGHRQQELGVIRLVTTLRNGKAAISLGGLGNHEQFNHVLAHFKLGQRMGEIPTVWDRLEHAWLD